MQAIHISYATRVVELEDSINPNDAQSDGYQVKDHVDELLHLFLHHNRPVNHYGYPKTTEKTRNLSGMQHPQPKFCGSHLTPVSPRKPLRVDPLSIETDPI
eukprot:TRINITY_DN16548_c1_g1_i2.p3 TRINITY_DN16548_c1_g1~~TRINITY_DN16548_c1_g1_i2.p3  ORF type:complete len:101 (+),score=11.12 TRINITY_DN16548_c1_g1_i2:418-720(+)